MTRACQDPEKEEHMERLAGGKTDASILSFIQGIQFPARKDEIVVAARRNGAPEDVVASLEQLPANDFASPQELIDAYPHLEELEE
jgi:hypothetical protein